MVKTIKLEVGKSRHQSAFMFPIVLVFLMIGSLLITPLVTFLATGLSNGTVYGRNVNEL